MLDRAAEDLRLSGNLPSPTGVGMRILQITASDEYSTDEMAQIILLDSALTSRIIKCANSAVHTGIEPVVTVQDAIMRLGSRTVRDLALAFTLISDRRAESCRSFNHGRYWSHSLARAVAAQSIAGMMGAARTQEAYICALLSDIGTLALASVHPARYERLLDQRSKGGAMEMLRLEQEAFDIDHVQASTFLLDDWGLPGEFGEAVSMAFGESAGQNENPDQMGAVLVVAERLAHCMTATPEGPPEGWSTCLESLDAWSQGLGMESADLSELYDRCVAAWISWGEITEIKTSAPRTLDMVRQLTVAPIAPTVRAASPAGELTIRVVRQDSGRGPIREVSEAFRVLIVDSGQQCFRETCDWLESAGHEVLQADGGEAGLRMALEDLPDVILLDADGETESGHELCKSLRRSARGSSMYIILLTSSDDETEALRAIDAGADETLTKPLTWPALRARIKGAVRVIRLQRKVAMDQRTLQAQIAEMGRLNRKLKIASLTDPLTGLPNRRFALNKLQAHWGEGTVSGQSLGIAIVDIDHFKVVNDTYGHDVGDVVLVEVARALRSMQVRDAHVCRLGGEEFIVILPDMDQPQAANYGQSWCDLVANSVAHAAGLSGKVTVSVGLAMRMPETVGFSDLMRTADTALYTAKSRGRNQCVVASPFSNIENL